MNKAFDYNGTLVSASKPVKGLKVVTKTFMVDSADRDTVKYYTNGDIVVYLPRVYENVVSLRLMAAEFPLLIDTGTTGALTHSYASGQNVPTATYSSDTAIVAGTRAYSFLIDVEGLNKTDECSVGAQRSTYPDGYFAKIPVSINGDHIEYNDHSMQDNTARYSPAIGKLDRLHIRTRLHSQQGNAGFLYWTTNGSYADNDNRKNAEYSLSFEIEYLENVFDDFSQFESRVSDRL
jgi:hypothetical protein